MLIAQYVYLYPCQLYGGSLANIKPDFTHCRRRYPQLRLWSPLLFDFPQNVVAHLSPTKKNKVQKLAILLEEAAEDAKQLKIQLEFLDGQVPLASII